MDYFAPPIHPKLLQKSCILTHMKEISDDCDRTDASVCYQTQMDFKTNSRRVLGTWIGPDFMFQRLILQGWCLEYHNLLFTALSCVGSKQTKRHN